MALRVTWWGAGTNVSLAAMKYVAGSITGSSALVADAAHSLSDLLSDLVTLFVVEAARSPPDAGHPYGHGRFEAVGSLSVAAILLATAGGVGWTSFWAVVEWWQSGVLENMLETSGYGSLAVAACVVSLVSKEALYHATVRIGREVDSQTLIANAWHHRSDALSSVAALLGVGGSMAGMPLLDPLAGVLVSGLVAKAGVEIGWEAVSEVTETAASGNELREAVRQISQCTDGVMGIDRLRVRKMGPYSLVDLSVEVDPETSISAAHKVAEHLRHQIQRSKWNVSEVLVSIVPFRQAAALSTWPQPGLVDEVREVLARDAEIRSVGHVTARCVPGAGVHVRAEIACDDALTVHQARGVVRRAQAELVGLQGVGSASIVLELSA